MKVFISYHRADTAYRRKLELILQNGVVVVKSGVVLGQQIEEIIHHAHVIATQRGTGEGVAGDLLRRHHGTIIPSLKS